MAVKSMNEERKHPTPTEELRDLVREMLRVAGVAEYATDAEWQTIAHYLRELGIEVDA